MASLASAVSQHYDAGGDSLRVVKLLHGILKKCLWAV